MKKDGGVIKNWQTHTITDNQDAIDLAKNVHENFSMDKAQVFTGTVVKDPTGRFEIGFHMRSSLIISFDKETGICETANTIYKLVGEEGNDEFFEGDMGQGIMAIYY